MKDNKGTTMKRVLMYIIIGSTCVASLSYSQTRKERVKAARAQIDSILATYANGPYEAGEVIDVDSSIGVRKVISGRISNPYGTLNRCYLFMAKTQGEDEKHTVGVYRDNQIIWMSEQLPGSQYYGYIDEAFIATKDLNRMGKVDIVVYFSDGTNPPSERYLWIFSWDGSQGVCINKQQTDSSTSIISSGAFNIYDVDGDGIDEVFSYKSDFSFDAVYSWNGSLYGVWPSTPDLAGRLYTIANNFTAIFNVVVTRDGEKCTCSYQVKNDQESKQKIKWISIGETNNLIDTIMAPSGWRKGKLSDYSIVRYNAVIDSLQLLAGSHATGFIIRCYGLPVISKYYLQAPYKDLDLSSVTDDELMNRMYQNILNNSFTGFTISAGNPPSPFVPLTFLDTLTDYTTQSRTLGWIKDSLTAVKYLGYFGTAKTKILQNDTATAKSTLRQVLTDVDVDSTSHLTSEAYALLRFNTEYLIPRIVPLDTIRVPSQYATIQAAINAADSGRTILVSAGTYNELVNISSKKMLKLVAVDKLVPLGNVTIQGITISNSSGITVKGFKINASGTSQDAVQITGAQNINITIEANEIQNSSKNGITLGQSNDNINIVNNVIANNDQNGISFTTGATGIQYIVNNTIVKNGKCGIEAVGPQKLFIVNNIIVYDTLAGRSGERLVKGSGTTYIMEKNNLVLRRQNGVLQSDYRLVPGSIAIDKGTTNFAPLPSKDKDDNPRVSGTTIDVGAYEYQQ
jgi:hypothetical protein